MSDAPEDAVFMLRALRLARERLGETGDNPAVGCVIVREGQVLGEAATAPGGRPHAEEQALKLAVTTGATAYLSLEPCAQRSSGSRSCADLLISAGVSRVVVAARDTSPMASGHGPRRLRKAGIEVTVGLLAEEAAPLYADYRARLAAPKAR